MTGGSRPRIGDSVRAIHDADHGYVFESDRKRERAMNEIYITGGAMTPFGRHTGVLAPELAQQAILKRAGRRRRRAATTSRRSTAPTCSAA